MRAEIRSSSALPLNEQAYARIREAIVFCELRPGSRVSEATLMKRFGLAQAAVRSAMPRLAQEGLIGAAEDRGSAVTPLTLKDVHEIYELRLLLEPHAAKLAARNGLDSKQVRVLRQIASTPHACETHEQIVKFLKVNREFNLGIASAADNAHLFDTISHLQDLTLRILYVGIPSMNAMEISERFYRAILEAVLDRDEARASARWVQDLEAGERVVSNAIMKLVAASRINLGAVAAERDNRQIE